MNDAFGGPWGGGSLDCKNIRFRVEAHLIQPSLLIEEKLEAQKKDINCPRLYGTFVAEEGQASHLLMLEELLCFI